MPPRPPALAPALPRALALALALALPLSAGRAWAWSGALAGRLVAVEGDAALEPSAAGALGAPLDGVGSYAEGREVTALATFALAGGGVGVVSLRVLEADLDRRLSLPFEGRRVSYLERDAAGARVLSASAYAGWLEVRRLSPARLSLSLSVRVREGARARSLAALDLRLTSVDGEDGEGAEGRANVATNALLTPAEESGCGATGDEWDDESYEGGWEGGGYLSSEEEGGAAGGAQGAGQGGEQDDWDSAEDSAEESGCGTSSGDPYVASSEASGGSGCDSSSDSSSDSSGEGCDSSSDSSSSCGDDDWSAEARPRATAPRRGARGAAWHLTRLAPVWVTGLVALLWRRRAARARARALEGR